MLLTSVAACADGVTPTSFGSIRLVLTGLHSAATSGGTVTATPTAGGNPVTISIPASGDQTAAVPVGQYSVQYTPPASHVLAPGQTVPSPISIDLDLTTTVTIALVSVGSLQVTVTGLTGSPSNGGSAVAQRTDAAGAPIDIAISAAGTGSANGVPTGTYTVTYTPPAGFNVSGTNPVTGLSVGLGTPAAASFSVGGTQQQTGAIQVNATGLTGATTGGTVSARLTNDTGSTFNGNLPVPTGGTASVNLPSIPPGSYNVTYTPPSGYRVVAGTANPQVATVTAGGTANVIFPAEVVPAPGGVIFHSDWSTGLGSTDAVVRDTGKASPWVIRGGSGLEVILSTGLDFPSTNCLRVTCQQANGGFAFLRKTGMPIPAVGASRWYRWYCRFALPDDVALQDQETHPIQDGNSGGDCNWLLTIYQDTATPGTWLANFRAAPNVSGDLGRWSAPFLQKNVTYRMELQIHRTGTTTFQMHIRIYNSAGTLLYDDDDLDQDFGNLTLANNPTFPFTNVNNLDGLNAGCNSLGGTDWHPSVLYMYQAAFAVSSADWIGPYANGI